MPNISIRLRAIIDYVTGVLLILLAFAIPYPDQSDEDDWALAGPEHLPHAMKGPSMRAVLIINPVSGDGEPNEEKVSTIQKWLTSVPFVAQVCYTTKERGAGVIARDAVAAGVEVVLVGGGDGTVSEIARELVDKPGTLGILPIGTFNNSARSIGVPADRTIGHLVKEFPPSRGNNC